MSGKVGAFLEKYWIDPVQEGWDQIEGAVKDHAQNYWLKHQDEWVEQIEKDWTGGHYGDAVSGYLAVFADGTTFGLGSRITESIMDASNKHKAEKQSKTPIAQAKEQFMSGNTEKGVDTYRSTMKDYSPAMALHAGASVAFQSGMAATTKEAFDFVKSGDAKMMFAIANLGSTLRGPGVDAEVKAQIREAMEAAALDGSDLTDRSRNYVRTELDRYYQSIGEETKWTSPNTTTDERARTVDSDLNLDSISKTADYESGISL